MDPSRSGLSLSPASTLIVAHLLHDSYNNCVFALNHPKPCITLCIGVHVNARFQLQKWSKMNLPSTLHTFLTSDLALIYPIQCVLYVERKS
ncbi:unnamed protein product [Boreogadus saida]